MKRILLSTSAIAVCICMSCNNADKGGMSDAAKKNLDANHAITKALETGDVSKLGDYMTTDAVDHCQTGDVKGLDSIKAEFTKMAPMMKDWKSTLIKETADDEYVFSWSNMSGNNTDPAMGPLGPTSINMVDISKYKDGKATEHWNFIDGRDMMKMMQAMMPQGDMAPMDHSKMDHMKMDTTKMK